jgi:hypothetical protein
LRFYEKNHDLLSQDTTGTQSSNFGQTFGRKVAQNGQNNTCNN